MIYLELVPDLHNKVFNIIILDIKFNFANRSIYLVAQSRPCVKRLNDAIDNKRHSINIHISKNHGYRNQELFRVINFCYSDQRLFGVLYFCYSNLGFFGVF